MLASRYKTLSEPQIRQAQRLALTAAHIPASPTTPQPGDPAQHHPTAALGPHQGSAEQWGRSNTETIPRHSSSSRLGEDRERHLISTWRAMAYRGAQLLLLASLFPPFRTVEKYHRSLQARQRAPLLSAAPPVLSPHQLHRAAHLPDTPTALRCDGTFLGPSWVPPPQDSEQILMGCSWYARGADKGMHREPQLSITSLRSAHLSPGVHFPAQTSAGCSQGCGALWGKAAFWLFLCSAGFWCCSSPLPVGRALPGALV